MASDADNQIRHGGRSQDIGQRLTVEESDMAALQEGLRYWLLQGRSNVKIFIGKRISKF